MKNPTHNTSSTGWLLAIMAIFFLTGAAAIVDPTRPPDELIPATKKARSYGPLQLTAIFSYPTHRLAIINGQLAAMGDQIGSYTIINIQDDTVELKGLRDKSIVLPLLPSIKQARIAK